MWNRHCIRIMNWAQLHESKCWQWMCQQISELKCWQWMYRLLVVFPAAEYLWLPVWYLTGVDIEQILWMLQFNSSGSCWDVTGTSRPEAQYVRIFCVSQAMLPTDQLLKKSSLTTVSSPKTILRPLHTRHDSCLSNNLWPASILSGNKYLPAKSCLAEGLCSKKNNNTKIRIPPQSSVNGGQPITTC